MRHANFDPQKKLLLKRFMNNIRAGDKKTYTKRNYLRVYTYPKFDN